MRWRVMFGNVDGAAPEAGLTPPARALRWGLRQLRPGFQHVGAWKVLPSGQVVTLNAIACGLSIQVLPAGASLEVLLECHANAYAVVAWDAPWPAGLPLGAWRPRGLFTCVSVVKAALGIGAPHVWTPWQLHCWLLRHGGMLLPAGTVF